MELFKLLGKVAIDNDEANKEIDATTGKAEKSESKISGAFKKIGTVVVSAFAVQKIVAFGKQVIETTAGIQAMEAQFEQVFSGDQQTAMESIAKQAKDLNIHADRLTGTWSSFGAQLKGAGMDGTEALENTEKATRLAADSAAFYDTSLEGASGSMASFMKGNFEAGDAIGVFTNAKQMDVKANEKYGKSWADLSEAERQWLLLDTIEKTYEMNGAMGQAQRESKNWANVTANLKSTWDRFLANIGTPVLEGATVVVEKLTNGIEWLGAKVSTIDFKAFAEGNPHIQSLMDIFTLLRDTVMGIWQNSLQPFVLDFITMLKSLQAPASEVIGAIIEYWKSLAVFWQTYVAPVIIWLVNLVRSNMDNIRTIIGGALDIVKNLFKLFTSVLKGDWSGAWEAIKGILSGAWNVIKGIFDTIKSVGSSIMEALKNILINIFENIKSGISTKIEGTKTAVLNIVENIKQGMIDKFNAAKDTVFAVFDRIKSGISDKINAAKDTVSGAIDKIKGFFNFSWSLPKLKLPHVSISGSFSLAPPKVPSFGIDWYKDGGVGVLTGPTAFGINPKTGSLRVGGEAEDEAIAPVSVLQQYIAEAVASQNQELITVLNLILKAIYALDSGLGNKLYNAMLGMRFEVNNREFARLVKAVN